MRRHCPTNTHSQPIRTCARSLARRPQPTGPATSNAQPPCTEAKEARRVQARAWLSSSNRQRAQEHGLMVFKVVFEQMATGKDGKL